MSDTILPEEFQRLKFAEFYANRDEKLYFEVPVFCRSVDVVKYNLLDNSITAIEFKIRDWKKALKQVLNVSMCFDYLAICIPKPKTEKGLKNIIDTCENIGVGIYFFDEIAHIFDHYKTEQKTSNIWERQREQVYKYLGGEAAWTKH